MSSYSLILAVCSRDEAEVQRLLDGGANINERDCNGTSAFAVAASLGYMEIMQMLYARGVEIHLKDYLRGYTALGLAIEAGHNDTVAWLLLIGSDASIETYNGRNALSLAIRCRNTVAVDIICDDYKRCFGTPSTTRRGVAVPL